MNIPPWVARELAHFQRCLFTMFCCVCFVYAELALYNTLLYMKRNNVLFEKSYIYYLQNIMYVAPPLLLGGREVGKDGGISTRVEREGGNLSC